MLFYLLTNRSGRNKLPIEVIGTYNPIPTPLTEQQKAEGHIRPIKDIALDFDRARYWIGVGAQPTEVVARLFRKAGILHPEWPAPHVGPKIPERKVEISAQGDVPRDFLKIIQDTTKLKSSSEKEN